MYVAINKNGGKHLRPYMKRYSKPKVAEHMWYDFICEK